MTPNLTLTELKKARKRVEELAELRRELVLARRFVDSVHVNQELQEAEREVGRLEDEWAKAAGLLKEGG